MTVLEDGTSKLRVTTLNFLSNYFPLCRLGRRKHSVSVASHPFEQSNNYTNIYTYLHTNMQITITLPYILSSYKNNCNRHLIKLQFNSTMYRREFLWIAQTTKSVELLKKIMKSFMCTLLKHTAFAGRVPMSSPVHIRMYVISDPLCKETINLVLVFNLVLISTSFRQLGFNLQENNASTITTMDGCLNSGLSRLPYISVE